MASTDTIEENTEFAKATSVTLRAAAAEPDGRREEGSRLPDAGRSDEGDGAAYGVLNGERTSASRWTFYIDKTGKVAAIDTAVRPRRRRRT